MEIWKDIEGYEGIYKISNYGNVYSSITNKNLLTRKHPDGYLIVKLYKNKIGNHYRVHRLVGQHFILNQDNKPDINHINGNKADNKVENLEWVTKSENTKHSYDILGKNIMSVIKLSIDGKFIENYKSIKEASIKNNINSSNITQTCQGKRKTTGGYRWIYEKDYDLIVN